MNIKYLTEADMPAWDAFVENHPDGTLYHKTVWIEIFKQAFNKSALYLYTEQNGAISAVASLIKIKSPITGNVLISLPFVNYGGLLYNDEQSKTALVEKISTIRKEENFISVELRAKKADAYNLPFKDNKITFLLELPETAEILNKQFKAKLRSQIRRPVKEGMYAKTGGLELLEDYYYVFCRNMRDLGTPVTGKPFFEVLLKLLPDSAKIVIIYSKDKKPVASAFILGYKDTLEIPWASSLRSYNRFSPNMLLYWEVLSFAISAGYKKFDFGRGTKEGGTYKFKKQWGGEEKQLFWYYILPPGEELPQVNKENPKYAMAINLWQKLPLMVANFLGPKISKHLP